MMAGHFQQMSTGTQLLADGVLVPVMVGCLNDNEHNWRLLPVVSRKFSTVWNAHLVPVLDLRAAFFEAKYWAAHAWIDDCKSGCSCGYAVGYHNYVPWR